MFISIHLKKPVLLALALAALGLLACALTLPALAAAAVQEEPKKDVIRWVDFDVPESLLYDLMEWDIESHSDPGTEHISWIDSLAYLATKYGGDFTQYRQKDLADLQAQAAGGSSPQKLGENLKYFSYYQEAYGAVLGGLLGEYQQETDSGWENVYGLKGFSPIAKGFDYGDYDDFGAGRSYGFARRHLGHDMLALVGTPVIAVESGTVEAMGWNQYGGWRIGIRSFDGLRYHYYAHLRKDRPYAQGLEVGQVVMAGDVIGYVGRTGYSLTENTNNINESHLHYGMQLVFDESQKETDSEIWIDVYSICRLLESHRSETVRDDATKEWSRAWGFREEVPENRYIPPPAVENA